MSEQYKNLKKATKEEYSKGVEQVDNACKKFPGVRDYIMRLCWFAVDQAMEMQKVNLKITEESINEYMASEMSLTNDWENPVESYCPVCKENDSIDELGKCNNCGIKLT